MKIAFCKFILIFPLLILSGCFSNQEEKTTIRFVDLQGNPRPIKTRIPEANTQILNGNSSANITANTNLQNPKLESKKTINNEAITKKPEPNPSINEVPAYQTLEKNLPQNNVETKFGENANENASTNEIDLKDSSSDVEIVENEENKNLEEIELSLSGSSKASNKNKDKNNVKKTFNNKMNKNKILTYVENNESSPENSTENDSAPAPDDKNIIVKTGARFFYVQVGSYNNSSSAKNKFASLKNFGKGKVVIGYKGDKRVYRAVYGPYKTRNQAVKMRDKISNSGNEAIIIRN